MTTGFESEQSKPHVVILGGGFGGLRAVQALRHAPVRITLIDSRNFHLFQPLLYQVATGALSPANIAAPLRAILKNQANVQVLLARAEGIDANSRTLTLDDGAQLNYDYLIVAVGVRPHYFGHEEWQVYAPGLKTIEDATRIRRRVLYAFEAAERDPQQAQEWLTFVVVGGGPTGVELAGAIGEMARYTLRGNFRNIDPTQARVILVEGAERVLPTYPPDLSARAAESLAKLGVSVRLNTLVTEVTPDSVTLQCGEERELVRTRTTLWSTGVRAAPFADALAAATNAPQDRNGRLIVQPDLTLPNYPEIFVIGDVAHYAHQTGKPLPGVAQVAMQQARYAARLIQARLRGDARAPKPFRYRDLGYMATIGRAAAVADLRGWHVHGFLGWLIWLFVHLMALVEFQNRILVLIQWAWNYFTRNRSARLITGEPAAVPEREQQAN
ncbi:MAG: FAD-dependent oxidoreductase [Candidatus Thermofonsia Clade 1 bacterium]|uniref:FAD-dependent oxidoreductase n=1 Tax=Candidatus Thermofonsia Clade 1 bacterium TaxID=2364210 RepID=A0A2M8PDQ4_9CHLR|nr:MAG: FAD-dependent oxidoreductase [Candidatus Thermofonsia Clade 1 bacterium]RMF54083.1 MAG: NAD(P)/FAD-dependent oxidoreductase [Chloroflexota bacterium]